MFLVFKDWGDGAVRVPLATLSDGQELDGKADVCDVTIVRQMLNERFSMLHCRYCNDKQTVLDFRTTLVLRVK